MKNKLMKRESRVTVFRLEIYKNIVKIFRYLKISVVL
jgi:hypothetical protein